MQQTQDSFKLSECTSNVNYIKKTVIKSGSPARKDYSAKNPYRGRPRKTSKNHDLNELEHHTDRSKLQQNNIFPNMAISSTFN